MSQAQEIVWIDVRTAQEKSARGIEGHPNIPYEEIGQRIGELNLEYGQAIRLYCRTGRRSGVATDSLKALGFTDVENAGSIDQVLDTL